MSSEPASNVGCKELLIWRMFMAIATSIAAQFLFMSCVLLLVNFRIMHPFSWILNTWTTVTSLRTWSYFLILAVVIFIQGIICSKSYLNAPAPRRSRFSAACNVFRPHNLSIGCLHVLVGGTLVWLHLSLEDGQYASLSTECTNGENQQCLVEEHFFLILSGLWMGFHFFVKSNFVVTSLQFPVIPRSRFSQIKGGIGNLLPVASLNAVWPTLYFIVLYYVVGGYCRDAIVSILSVQTSDTPLDSVYGLLNFSLAFYTWLFSVLFLLTMNTMHLCFEAHLTQRVTFEIKQQNMYLNEGSAMTLADAMATDKVPIVQHLAYLDLVILAQKEKFRRAVLFTLSKPGCRPCNWQNVASKCLNLLNKFTLDVNDACSKNQKLKSPTVPATGFGDTTETLYFYKMRRLMMSDEGLQSPQRTVNSKPNSSDEQRSLNFFKGKRDQFVGYIFSKPIFRYIFEETTNDKIRKIFINAQPVVWAADAISSLIVISLKEDQYGVIQQDLPTIISTLLVMKEALDKLHRVNLFAKKSQNDDKHTRQMLTFLRAAIKRSIYRITSEFKEYIKDLSLEPEIVMQLQNFISYRE